MTIQVGGADVGFDDEEHQVRLTDGQLRLAANGRFEAVPARQEAAGVHEEERPPVPLRHRDVAVARDPRTIVDDRQPLSHQAVEEGRLAYVRTTDDGYQRKRHAVSMEKGGAGNGI